MNDYWLSTKSPAGMLRSGCRWPSDAAIAAGQSDGRPAYQTAERDQFLRETIGVDPAVLGIELGMSATMIRIYQRKLGLRKLTGNRTRQFECVQQRALPRPA